MQAQSNVGIFCGIVGCRCQIDLIKANLMHTLAAHFFIANGFHTQMAFRQAIHIVGQMGFQHIGLQQGVVLYPA